MNQDDPGLNGENSEKFSTNYDEHTLFVSHLGTKFYAKELREMMKIRDSEIIRLGIRMRHSTKVPKDDRNTRKNCHLKQSGNWEKTDNNFKMSVRIVKTW